MGDYSIMSFIKILIENSMFDRTIRLCNYSAVLNDDEHDLQLEPFFQTLFARLQVVLDECALLGTSDNKFHLLYTSDSQSPE